MWPVPGTATEADAIHSDAWYGVRCELVDGTLVAKATVQYPFTFLEWRLGAAIAAAAFRPQAGVRLGYGFWDHPLRCGPATVRRPTYSLFATRSLTDVFPPQPVADAVPDLMVDLHLIGNTPAELARRRRDYFAAGVPAVWSVHPAERTVIAYTDPETCHDVTPDRPAPLGDAFPGAGVLLRPAFDQFEKRRSLRVSRDRPA